MQKNLVIVESPAKAKTIEKFLGNDYKVMSSFGHIRDLKKSSSNSIGIDIEHDYAPHYEVPADKKALVAELKKNAKEAETVWLASDEDREGEAIAWHLFEVLGLNKETSRRIVFHEITKNAILHAIETPRDIDINLVCAQQARRVLDRIVGFELSPILWRKVKPNLSAGRVQSVTVRLIVDREREIKNFVTESSFRIRAVFMVSDTKGKEVQLCAEFADRLKSEAEVNDFLEHCKDAVFTVDAIEKKPTKKHPAAPFTTSTLQQEASRKLGFSVAQTMSVAQHLYESGHITYMRTDSVNLSSLALNTAKDEIITTMGVNFHHLRQYQTKSKGAQEAHEAIRPTYLNHHEIEGTSQEKKLYNLIWKRTIASQMEDAEIEKTTISISVSGDSRKFTAEGEILLFDGFLRVYMESTDDDEIQEKSNLLPPLNVGDHLTNVLSIEACQRFTQRPPRYTEASLVRKLEELGIGRPSTYASTISTIQNRGYVVREDRDGVLRYYKVITLANGEIHQEEKTEITGQEKAKLFPTDTGIVVNDFLKEYFPTILDYNFTANVEKTFDDVAEGKEEWTASIDSFYKTFHPTVENAVLHSEKKVGERKIGIDPASGKPVFVKIGKFGPVAQIGTAEDEEKPKFASLKKNQSIETITFEEVMDLFKLPRVVGEFEDFPMSVAIGRFGPYIKHNSKYYSLGKTDDPMQITQERAVEIILTKREQDANKHIKHFDASNIDICNGRFGPYLVYKEANYRLPKSSDPQTITEEECLQIIEKQGLKEPKKKGGKTVKKKDSTSKEEEKETEGKTIKGKKRKTTKEE